MTFKNLNELIDEVNKALGSFCNIFQSTRKNLLGMKRQASNSILFEHSKNNREWAINPGGGTEFQYHINIENGKLYYGLGFNAQYVPFKNKRKPVEYIQPYIDSYLNEREIKVKLFQLGFNYYFGNDKNLLNIKENDYVLIGKEMPLKFSSNSFVLHQELFDEMIKEFKTVLFESYKKVLKNMNLNSKMTKFIQDKINILFSKKQIILQGPPGTGKTYTAQDIAYQAIFNKPISHEMEKRQIDLVELDKSERFRFVQFHPSYTYEDFVRGIMSEVDENGNINYKVANKILADFAKRAEDDNEDRPHILIIDEINRANLSSVLGELIYALEYRNRGVDSMYALRQKDNKTEGSYRILIPENLYIIGTMNTADRSVGHIDYAIRRRFAFVDVLPKDLTDLGDNFMSEIFKIVSSLFVKEIKSISAELEASEHLSAEFADRPQDVWLGHSYFIDTKDVDFKVRIEYEIIPILEEYIKDGILKNSPEVKNILKKLLN